MQKQTCRCISNEYACPLQTLLLEAIVVQSLTVIVQIHLTQYIQTSIVEYPSLNACMRFIRASGLFSPPPAWSGDMHLDPLPPAPVSEGGFYEITEDLSTGADLEASLTDWLLLLVGISPPYTVGDWSA